MEQNVNNNVTNWRNGTSGRLTALAAELERQMMTKRDFVVDTRTTRAVNLEGHLSLQVDDGKTVPTMKVRPYALKQIAAKEGIPTQYVDRMVATKKIDLLVDNVNAWVDYDAERRLLRSVDNEIRAFLSDRYRRVDNHDVFFLALEEFKKAGAEVVAAEMTETHLYLKATTGGLEDLTGKNDMGRHGLIIRNSEVGASSFRVDPYVWRQICSNGLIGESVISKIHLGRRQDVGEMFSSHTRQLEDKVLFSSMRDVIRNTFDERVFTTWMEDMKFAANTTVKKPVEAFDYVAKTYHFSDDLKTELLNHFAVDPIAGPTVWGMVNAVTSVAKTQDIDRQVELEAMANTLLTDKRLLEVIA